MTSAWEGGSSGKGIRTYLDATDTENLKCKKLMSSWYIF